MFISLAPSHLTGTAALRRPAVTTARRPALAAAASLQAERWIDQLTGARGTSPIETQRSYEAAVMHLRRDVPASEHQTALRHLLRELRTLPPGMQAGVLRHLATKLRTHELVADRGNRATIGKLVAALPTYSRYMVGDVSK